MARLDRSLCARGQKKHRGFTMLETLITLAVITIWLLGSANVQPFALRLNKAAQFRTQAVMLASEMAERIEANKIAALTGAYVYTGSGASSSKDCTTANCSASELRDFDLVEWTTRVAATLPNAAATITADVNNPINYTIVVNWTDRRTDQNYGSTGTSEAFSYTATRTVFNDTH